MENQELALMEQFFDWQNTPNESWENYSQIKILATPIYGAYGITGFTMVVESSPIRGALICLLKAESNYWIGFFCDAENGKSKIVFDTTESQLSKKKEYIYNLVFSNLESKNCVKRSYEKYFSINAHWVQPVEINAHWLGRHT